MPRANSDLVEEEVGSNIQQTSMSDMYFQEGGEEVNDCEIREVIAKNLLNIGKISTSSPKLSLEMIILPTILSEIAGVVSFTKAGINSNIMLKVRLMKT